MMGIYSDLLFLLALTQYATCQKVAGQLSNPTLQGPEKVKLNETETISCIASSEKLSILYSLYRGKTLVQVQNVSTSEPANFSVSFHSQTDGGTYKCKVESDDAMQTKYSNSINIIVLAPVLGVSITSVPDPPVLKVHDKLTLNCLVKQGSGVTYQWYFNKQELLSNSSVKINQSSLVIDHVDLKDAGDYQCKANNQFNMTTFSIASNSTEVIVKDLSVKLTSNPDPPIQGYQVTLNCSITYQTTGFYTWYFVHSENNSTESTKQNQFTHIASHPGRYYCSINGQTSNWIQVLGQDSSFQTVTVAVSVAVTMLLILVLGLICYCISQKAHRCNID
ncbi:Fc receptor-like protein 5 isoform X5 [Chiloscyllium plagiosum]|uniref:Fc receptor-like protein 5 isoform X5 n=1 Tax=Chiloscyllium plagiosum TaxID=36176 RepID=UPI001CB7EA0E|nr:Fc receptor-like protein 5 isoform X5 [Chiloscyllium plagiosum]